MVHPARSSFRRAATERTQDDEQGRIPQVPLASPGGRRRLRAARGGDGPAFNGAVPRLLRPRGGRRLHPDGDGQEPRRAWRMGSQSLGIQLGLVIVSMAPAPGAVLCARVAGHVHAVRAQPDRRRRTPLGRASPVATAGPPSGRSPPLPPGRRLRHAAADARVHRDGAHPSGAAVRVVRGGRRIGSLGATANTGGAHPHPGARTAGGGRVRDTIRKLVRHDARVRPARVAAQAERGPPRRRDQRASPPHLRLVLTRSRRLLAPELRACQRKPASASALIR